MTNRTFSYYFNKHDIAILNIHIFIVADEARLS